MSTTPEQASRWPKSRDLEDAFVVCAAVVYESSE